MWLLLKYLRRIGGICSSSGMRQTMSADHVPLDMGFSLTKRSMLMGSLNLMRWVEPTPGTFSI